MTFHYVYTSQLAALLPDKKNGTRQVGFRYGYIVFYQIISIASP